MSHTTKKINLYMKKGSKEMLKTIISNQELIMKALKIEVPVVKIEKSIPAKVEVKKPAAKKAASKKAPAKKSVKKVVRK